MTDYLFDTPWWLPLAVVVIGIVLWASGNRRVDRTLKRFGAAVMLAGLLIAGISYFVDTDKEKALAKTSQLVQAVSSRDWAKFQEVLHPKVQFMLYKNRDALVSGAKATADQIGLKWVKVTGTQVKQDPQGVVVDLSCFSDQDAVGQMIKTSWRFDFTEGSDGWLITKITFIPDGALKPDQIEKRLVR